MNSLLYQCFRNGRWRKNQRTNLSHRRPTALTCAHDACTVVLEIVDKAITHNRDENDAPVFKDCPLCEFDAVESVDLAFAERLTLPLKTPAMMVMATASAQPSAGAQGQE